MSELWRGCPKLRAQLPYVLYSVIQLDRNSLKLTIFQSIQLINNNTDLSELFFFIIFFYRNLDICYGSCVVGPEKLSISQSDCIYVQCDAIRWEQLEN